MIRSGILTIDVNDHCPTFIPFVTHSITGGEESVKVSFRCDTEENRENFMAKLKSCEWRMGNINVNAVANLFISQLNKLYCDCFPVKTKYISPKRLQKPWLTTDIVEMIGAKSKYFKSAILMKHTRSPSVSLVSETLMFS